MRRNRCRPLWHHVLFVLLLLLVFLLLLMHPAQREAEPPWSPLIDH